MGVQSSHRRHHRRRPRRRQRCSGGAHVSAGAQPAAGRANARCARTVGVIRGAVAAALCRLSSPARSARPRCPASFGYRRTRGRVARTFRFWIARASSTLVWVSPVAVADDPTQFTACTVKLFTRSRLIMILLCS